MVNELPELMNRNGDHPFETRYRLTGQVSTGRVSKPGGGPDRAPADAQAVVRCAHRVRPDLRLRGVWRRALLQRRRRVGGVRGPG